MVAERFHLDLVPPGRYRLHVIPGLQRLGEDDAEPGAGIRPTHFDHPDVDLTVADSDVTLPDILLGERMDSNSKEP